MCWSVTIRWAQRKLGIGGEPGVQINLNEEMGVLTENVDKAALARAVKRVHGVSTKSWER